MRRPNASTSTNLQWDIFCKVIDNLGDIGVCWRLASQLADAGDGVRLWVDDSSALAFMAPNGQAQVQVMAWDDAHRVNGSAIGDVVVEAFACDPPTDFVAAMAHRTPPPVWINLEYLSAESWVEACHGLPSPNANGLTKWFYQPGFTAKTGGLLKPGPDLASDKATTDLLSELGVRPSPGERLVSLFCYEQAHLDACLYAWANPSFAPNGTCLLVTPGHAAHQLQPWLNSSRQAPPGLRLVALPWVTQDQYDQLLQACDLNLVRGEDSLVRAIWAKRPFLWHIYPQHDGAHLAKLSAFMNRYLRTCEPSLHAAIMSLALAWVEGAVAKEPDRRVWPLLSDANLWTAWQAWALAQSDRWQALPKLVEGLRNFAIEKRAGLDIQKEG